MILVIFTPTFSAVLMSAANALTEKENYDTVDGMLEGKKLWLPQIDSIANENPSPQVRSHSEAVCAQFYDLIHGSYFYGLCLHSFWKHLTPILGLLATYCPNSYFQ